MRRLRDREDRLRALKSARDAAVAATVAPIDRATLLAGLRGLLAEWRRLLRLSHDCHRNHAFERCARRDSSGLDRVRFDQRGRTGLLVCAVSVSTSA